MLKKCLLFLCLLFTGLFLQAAERITDFSVTAKINTDGSADISEIISVVAEHRFINRGIYRDIPLKAGERITDITLEMDGHTHPFFTENYGRKKRINFGDDNYISAGPHAYILNYRIHNVVRLFGSYDEFYWNVTGSEWAFPIEHASITVVLPDGVQPDESLISSYVGEVGTQGETAAQNGLFFESDTIYPGQDFTVAVPFPKGFITLSAGYYLRYFTVVTMFVLAVVLMIYYYWAWNKVGRDVKPHVITRYEPPANLSPAQMRYIHRMGDGDKANYLPITIVSAAMKGAIAIEQDTSFLKKDIFLRRKTDTSVHALSKEESLVTTSLFRRKLKIKLNDKENASAILRLKGRLIQTLAKETSPYFRTNAQYNQPTVLYLLVWPFILFYWKVALALFGGLFIVSIFMENLTKKTLLIIGGIIAAGAGFVLWTAWQGIWAAFMANWVICSECILLGIVAVIGGLFGHWVKAYTPKGRAVEDHILGFKRYLEIGEQGRVAASDPTDELRIFCNYLPYAYALGVESKWMKQFENKFSAQEIHSTMHSRGFIGFTSLNTVSSVSSALSSVSSAVSSGSGGHGHAGGGSGGGGGGGR